MKHAKKAHHYDELLANDTSPKALLEESYEFLGDTDLPYENHISPEIAASEYEKLWSKVWQWACHVDHIPEPGDYFVYDVGHLSSLIVRTTDGSTKRITTHVCIERNSNNQEHVALARTSMSLPRVDVVARGNPR